MRGFLRFLVTLPLQCLLVFPTMAITALGNDEGGRPGLLMDRLAAWANAKRGAGDAAPWDDAGMSRRSVTKLAIVVAVFAVGVGEAAVNSGPWGALALVLAAGVGFTLGLQVAEYRREPESPDVARDGRAGSVQP